MSEHLAIHYSRVLDELEKRRDELSSIISQDYIERAIVGLNHWIEAGENNHLTWGILHFYKR
ncbi:MAG: hypothetical protein GY847_34800 [Proteobacteria bacterium]|nr:hypothetical protein [Pseudomonadota bacterium]